MALIRAVAEGEAAEAWARALGEDWTASATTIKAEGDCGVWRATLAGRDVVIKTWRLKGGPRRRAQSILTLSPAWRHWRAARALDAAGFATARPLAIATIAIDAAPAEALVLEALPGPTALEALARPLAPPVENAVARAIGAQVGRLAGAGWYNRDHKPSNLIVTHLPRSDAPGEARVAMIDCVGFRRITPGSHDHLARMLAKLLIEPIGCNLPPRRALRWCVLRSAAASDRAQRSRPEARAQLRGLWNDIERLVSEHGDPAPKLNPLASPRLPRTK